MSAELAVVGDVVPEATLEELRDVANREHGLAETAAGEAIRHAILAGEALLVARGRVGRGQWEPWVQANFARPTMARPYMRLAHYKHLVLDQRNVREAQLYLRGLPSFDETHNGKVDTGLADEIKRLVEGGTSKAATARMLGVSLKTVQRAVFGPGYARGRSEVEERSYRRRLAREKAARTALREQEQRRTALRAAQKAGGAMAEAYSLAERMQDVLGSAHREAENQDARVALFLAGEHYRKMRDEIVRALGVYDRKSMVSAA